MGAIFLGLDCGGSSSRAVAVDEEGEVLHQGQSGSANLASTPMFRLRQNLANATRGCRNPSHVYGCFAGLLTSDDRSRAIALLRELFPNANVDAAPDYAAAFFACEEGTDLCVISGTGSLVCSAENGRIVKSGGRGYILGDEGSAYQYGKDALLSYLANPNGSSDALKKCIVDLFDAEDEPTIVSRLYRQPSPQATLGKLAKPLAADCKAGADYAMSSVTRNTSALVEVVATHRSRHLTRNKQIRLTLSGGLWKISPVFLEAFASELAKSAGCYVTERIKNPPVYGAVRLAKEMAIGH